MTAPQDPYSYPGGGPGDPGGYPGGTEGAGGPAPRPGPQVFSIIAMVCGVLAILLVPILFGPIGIILAIVGNRRGERLWKVALAVAIGGMVLGFILGAIMVSNN